MNKKDAEKVLKETIEYANDEIKKNKKRFLKISASIIGIIAVIVAAGYFIFGYEAPVQYKEGMISAKIPEDKGLDIRINLPNYKTAKAVLVKIDDNTYDLYINVTQTLATKIFKDSDTTDNMLRVGNSLVVDFQSGLLMGYMPNGNSADSIEHIYYIDNLSKKTMTMDDVSLINYQNKTLIWERLTLKL